MKQIEMKERYKEVGAAHFRARPRDDKQNPRLNFGFESKFEKSSKRSKGSIKATRGHRQRFRLNSILKRPKGTRKSIVLHDNTLDDKSSIDSIEKFDKPNDNGTLSGGTVQNEFMEKLYHIQKKYEILVSKCRQLEAHNVISSAQQLEIISQLLAYTLSIVSLILYWKVIWWILQDNHLVMLFDTLIIKSPQKNQGTKALKVLHLFFPDTIKGMQSLILPHAFVTLRYIFAVLPYFHNKMNYGLTHRRFDVFAVAFIMIVRVKLVKRRIKTFIKSEENEISDGVGKSTFDDDYHVLKKSQFGLEINEDDIWDANYEINARFLYSSILRLRGLWTKTAQYVSSRADFVPIPYIRELSKLQDEAPETSWSDVENILKKAGIMNRFRYIEKKPLASASIGQVHVATLINDGKDKSANGEKVVIKVQHPHARTLLMDDFVSLKIISRIITLLEPEYEFFEVLMKEWSIEAYKELDFLSELANLELAQSSVEKMGPLSPLKKCSARKLMTNSYGKSIPSIPFHVEIPLPYKSLSSKNVLVMTFCEGKRIDDLDQIHKCNVPRESIMDAVAQIFAHMMYVTDIFNGDPHPGNIFIRPGISSRPKGGLKTSDGFTIVLLDWGLAKKLPDSKRVAFCQMTYAASTLDFGLMMDAFNTMGLKLKRENVAEDMEGVRFMLRDMATREKTRKRIKAKMKTDIERSKKKTRGERVPVDSKAYPGEFFFFVRTNELLHGLGSSLHVEMSYLDILKPFAERGLLMSDKYHAKGNLPDPIETEMIGDAEMNKSIKNVLDVLEKKGSITGAQVCVVDCHGHTLAHVTKGNMGSLKRNLPMRSDALVLGFSVSKGISATLAHIMVEEGYLSYDEPICNRVWKKFCPSSSVPEILLDTMAEGCNIEERWKWKRLITLRHILTHTTGLWSALPSKLSIKSLSCCETCCAAFEFNVDRPSDTILPIDEPGTRCAYQYLSFGWLVAGTLKGAYACRHDKTDVTYSEVYENILVKRLSPKVLQAGFRPCGGSGDHDMALVDAELDVSRVIQLQREAQAMGEQKDDDIIFNKQKISSPRVWNELRESLHGKEFILDPRIWNSEVGQNANVPAAGGRFSAKGLALFYHELGSGNILSPDVLEKAIISTKVESNLQELESLTMLTPENIEESERPEFGLGFQTFALSNNTNKDSFGHAGVGGSIGLYNNATKISVGIMLNKIRTDENCAKKIIEVISKHLKCIP